VKQGMLNSLGSEIWWIALAAVCLASGLGFVAGFQCARLRDRQAYQRARQGVARLYQTMVESIDATRELCTLLEREPGSFLKPEQVDRLEKRRIGLLEAIGRLVQRHTSVPEPVQAESAAVPAFPESIEWVMDPADSATGLPDRPAFDANLNRLLELSRETRTSCALLLIRIDRMSGLVTRVGQGQAVKLLRRLAAVVCRGVRDQDLICKCSPDTIGVLLPKTEEETAAGIGRIVRDAVRGQQFRIEDTGQEILLTASFGLTTFRTGDSSESVLNRTFDALAKSQRLGRNQLHVHNGESLIHCTAT
jgi:diguanylate cyclase (GGDEF)-like protein